MCNREKNDKKQRDRRQGADDNDGDEGYANTGSKTRSSHYSNRRAAGLERLKRQTANKIAGEMAINTVGHGRAKGPLLATVDQLVGQNCQQPQRKQQQTAKTATTTIFATKLCGKLILR